MHGLVEDQQTAAADKGSVEVMGAEAGMAAEWCVDRVFFVDSRCAQDLRHKMSCMDLNLKILAPRKIAVAGSLTSKTSVESHNDPYRTAKVAS
jgi:hypothetical protein